MRQDSPGPAAQNRVRGDETGLFTFHTSPRSSVFLRTESALNIAAMVSFPVHIETRAVSDTHIKERERVASRVRRAPTDLPVKVVVCLLEV